MSTPSDPHTSLRAELADCKRVVVKVGSSLLTDLEHGLDEDKIIAYSADLAALKRMGHEMVLVSSGAVAEGCVRLGWRARPESIHRLQAAAAVGQMGLVQAYESALAAHQCRAAMVMLTHDDLANRQRYLNARSTLTQLLALSVVPVINENDTVATDEIRFGDNDTLAALVANLLEADLLVILTDVEGLMDKDPRVHGDARLVDQAHSNAAELDQLPGQNAGALGRGGMVTKLRAARLAARSGAHTVIANGSRKDVIRDVVAGRHVGTLLTAEMTPLTARKRWIAGQLRASGTLVVDDGAAAAILNNGVSLLAVGVVEVEGDFLRGDVVRIRDAAGRQVAQGLSNYSAAEIASIRGLKSDAFVEQIGYAGEPELVHRDNLVVI